MRLSAGQRLLLLLLLSTEQRLLLRLSSEQRLLLLLSRGQRLLLRLTEGQRLLLELLLLLPLAVGACASPQVQAP